MPIYEYRRPDGTTFDVIQKFSDDPLTVDPETGVPVERVLSAPAIHFKGSGFHNTDYGTKKRNREKAANSSSSDGASASPSTGGDTGSASTSGDSGSSSSTTSSSAATGSSTSSST